MAAQQAPRNDTAISPKDTLVCPGEIVTYKCHSTTYYSMKYHWLVTHGSFPDYNNSDDVTVTSNNEIRVQWNTSDKTGSIKCIALHNSTTVSESFVDTHIRHVYPVTGFSPSLGASSYGNHEFNVSAIAQDDGFSNYHWTLPVGWSIDPLNDFGKTIRIRTDYNTPGYVTCTATLDSCNLTTTTFSVYITRVPPTPVLTNVPNNIDFSYLCPGGFGSITVTSTYSGPSEYTWTVLSGPIELALHEGWNTQVITSVGYTAIRNSTTKSQTVSYIEVKLHDLTNNVFSQPLSITIHSGDMGNPSILGPSTIYYNDLTNTYYHIDSNFSLWNINWTYSGPIAIDGVGNESFCKIRGLNPGGVGLIAVSIANTCTTKSTTFNVIVVAGDPNIYPVPAAAYFSVDMNSFVQSSSTLPDQYEISVIGPDQREYIRGKSKELSKTYQTGRIPEGLSRVVITYLGKTYLKNLLIKH